MLYNIISQSPLNLRRENGGTIIQHQTYQY